MTDYQTLNAQLRALIGGVPHRVANLANAAALLYHTLDGLNWAGFYLLSEDVLVLGPFQGKPAGGPGRMRNRRGRGQDPARAGCPPVPRTHRLRQCLQF